MIKKRTIYSLLLLFFICKIFATPNYLPLQLTGYNSDVVCNASSCSGTNTLDGQWFYYSETKNPAGALPQIIVSNAGVEYNLADFNENNALVIKRGSNSSGNLELKEPINAKELWILGISANNEKDIEISINYLDGSISDKIKISFSDWYQSDGSKAAYYGLGRASGTNNFDGRLEFGLFERTIPIDETKAVKSVEFEYNGTDNTYTTIFAITAYLGGRGQSDKELYMISNAHFDTQWDWDVQTSIDQYVKNTLEGNFNLFEKYPNYKFNFEGAIKYKFAKEYYPDLYNRLKGYIASGRWNVSGSSFDANDVMVPSAESIIRNFLLGHTYFKKEFNVDGGNDVMLPDCFGFPHSLPSLAAHCGIVGFHTQKLSWGSAYDYNSLPHYGLWRGIDGSEIYAVYKPGAYVNQYRENLAYNGNILNEIISNKSNLGSNKTVRYFGTGDRGGSVDDNTADWLEKSLAADGPVKVFTVTPDEFFNSFTTQERNMLPIWDNELPMTAHGVGCYSSHTILKYWNRKGELLADATEKSSVIADWLGGLNYQKETINNAWENILWHQFHDDLTGTSIPRAYVFTYNDHVLGLLNLSKTLDNSVGAIARKMDTQTVGIPIVVYNPLSIEREDIVEAQVEVDSPVNNINVYDSSGKAVLSQIIKNENGVLSFIFKANLPSLGYSTYDLRLNDDNKEVLSSSLKTTVNTIENESYILKLNKNGDVFSVLDKKQNNKELLSAPIRLSMQSNQPGYWASWELSWGDVSRSPYAFVDSNVEMTLVEEGPLRATFKIRRTRNGSEFVQLIRMTSGVNADRIDFVNEVDWQSKQSLLKAEFPLSASNPVASYDGSLGIVERGNNTNNLYEVAGHQWADITNSDNSYGISIFNDSKYGWDKPTNNKLRLTLIHTPKVESDRPFQQYQDLGLNKFTYSFYRHLGALDENTQWEAAKLNQELVAYQAPKHEGELGKNFEFLKLNTNKIAVKAVKQAEFSDEIIVRVYEIIGENHQNVELSFAENIISAREVNGREQDLGSIYFSTNKIQFSINRFQPKTFAVKLQTPKSNLVVENPISKQVDLEYNIDVMSTDDNIRNGRFGTSFYVYPAELFSDTIISDGIKFTVGPRTDRMNNAVLCQGQQINLPQNTSNKKLYILAASQNVEGSEVNFKIDGVDKPTKVGYFAEQVGSWGSVYGERQYRKENIAFTATHRHNYSMNRNDSYSYLYIYKYVYEIDANTKTLTLPNDEDIVVFAVTVSDNENDDIKSLTDTQYLPDHEYITPASEEEACGNRLIPNSIIASGRTNINEHESKAADNNPNTKWNDDSNVGKFIQYDFDNEVQICQWNLLHAGLENDNNITSDFTLQTRSGNQWIDIDDVKNNRDNKNIRFVNPFITSSIRIKITKPQQNDGKTARIYSFDVFGNVLTKLEKINRDLNYSVYVNNDKKIIVKLTASTENLLNNQIELFDSSGRKIFTKEIIQNETVINQDFNSGVYLIKIQNEVYKVII